MIFQKVTKKKKEGCLFKKKEEFFQIEIYGFLFNTFVNNLFIRLVTHVNICHL